MVVMAVEREENLDKQPNFWKQQNRVLAYLHE
jgi:hypothetical protein